MAIYNEILAPRYARALQKLFGTKGGVPTKQLAGEIATAFPLFNGAENRFLEGWSRFGARVQLGAVAAQDDVVRLNNPAGSNTVAVIESIKITLGLAAGEAVIEYSPAASGALTTVVTPGNLDTRSNPPGTGSNGAQCSFSGQNNIGQGTHVVFDDVILATANNTSNEVVNYDGQEICLPPNTSVQVRSLSVNLSMTITMRWRERFLEEAERQ